MSFGRGRDWECTLRRMKIKVMVPSGAYSVSCMSKPRSTQKNKLHHQGPIFFLGTAYSYTKILGNGPFSGVPDVSKRLVPQLITVL